MKKDVNIDAEIKRVMESFHADFNPYFETRLMGSIANIKSQSYRSEIFDLVFKRVMVVGVAALAAMLILTFILNGGLSYDALLGIGDLGMENAIAMSITGF